MWRGVADDFQRSIKGWTVTTNGTQSADPYFIRLSKTGDPNAAITYNVGNGGPTLDQRDMIDAGFLELLPPRHVRCRRSRLRQLAAASSTRPSRATPTAARAGIGTTATATATAAPTAIRGRRATREPAICGPALTAERGRAVDLQTGDPAFAAQLLDAMAQFSSGVGLIAEQSWEFPDLAASPFGTDPTIASIGFENGKPAGSASPLVWSAGSFVRLAADLPPGELVDQPANTVERYITNTQGQTTLTLTAPADQTAVSGSPLTVSGTTARRQHRSTSS